MDAVQHGWVEMAGARIHYLRAGAGPALILIHGLVGSARNWEANLADLARHSTVYALDLMSMGESDRVAGLDPRLAAEADRIAAFMDALQLAEADVAGHSHGGAIAFSRTGDPNTGEFSDAVVLATYGDVDRTMLGD